MAKQSRQRSDKKFSGNHQRSWLWGYHAVYETLAAGKWPVLEVLVTPATYDRARQLLEEKQRQGLSVQQVTVQRLEELSHTTEHQGILARLGPFPYASLLQLDQELQLFSPSSNSKELSNLRQSGSNDPPLVVMCDRLQDSFNLGAILRGCAAANVMAVIVGEKSQSEINSHVSRSSAGAINQLMIVKTDDLVATAMRLKSLGLQLLAADANTTTSMWDADLRQPALLIIGSEARGVDDQLLAICDQRLVIPMNSQVNSLNAAVATGILLYEIRRQQRRKPT